MENKLELAEIIGIMLGDGCLYKEKKHNRYQTTICFHKKEIDYLRYVKILFENYFKYKFYITEIEHEMLLRNGSLRVGKKLISFGLHSGSKIDNKVIIPSWIFENTECLKRTVRGLFDTDGCVYKKYDKYAQIVFKFGCEETTHSLRKAMIILNFKPTKIEKGYNKERRTFFYKFYLSRQDEIRLFFQEIEPKNQKHVKRYQRIISGDAATSSLTFEVLPSANI